MNGSMMKYRLLRIKSHIASMLLDLPGKRLPSGPTSQQLSGVHTGVPRSKVGVVVAEQVALVGAAVGGRGDPDDVDALARRRAGLDAAVHVGLDHDVERVGLVGHEQAVLRDLERQPVVALVVARRGRRHGGRLGRVGRGRGGGGRRRRRRGCRGRGVARRCRVARR